MHVAEPCPSTPLTAAGEVLRVALRSPIGHAMISPCPREHGIIFAVDNLRWFWMRWPLHEESHCIVTTVR